MCEAIFLLALHVFKVWQKQLYIYILNFYISKSEFADGPIKSISYSSIQFYT